MRRLLAFASLALATAATALELETIALPDGTFPVQTVATGTGRLLVVDLRGRVLEVVGSTVAAEPWLAIPGVRSNVSESGLLGIALHPDFDVLGAPGRGLLWAYYSRGIVDDVEDVLVRYRVPAGASRPDLASAVELLTIPSYGECHHGGQILFGPPEGEAHERYLYLTTGDACHALTDPRDPSNPHGKILRLRPSLDERSGPPWSAPADNPWSQLPGLPALAWAVGLRNPWRASFAPDGALWIGDVGDQQREEIDRIPLGIAAADLGWPVLEGTRCLRDPGCTPFGLLPAFEYAHVFDGDVLECAVTGGVTPSVGPLAGQHVYADYCSGRISALSEVALGTWSARRLATLPGSYITSLALGDDGAPRITALFRGGSVLHRLAGAPGPLAIVTTKVRLARAEGAFPMQLVAEGGASGPSWSVADAPPGLRVGVTGLVDFAPFTAPFPPSVVTLTAASGGETASLRTCVADPAFVNVRRYEAMGNGAEGSPSRTFRVTATDVAITRTQVRVRMTTGYAGCIDVMLVRPPPREADAPALVGRAHVTAAQPEAIVATSLSMGGAHGTWRLVLLDCSGREVADGLVQYEVVFEGTSLGCHDSDGDGVPSPTDACVAIFDPLQADDDADGLADACEREWGDIAPPFGAVDIGDVVRALRASVGLVTLSRVEVQLADVSPAWRSSDGLTRPFLDDVATLDVADVSTLLRASVGLERFGPLA